MKHITLIIIAMLFATTTFAQQIFDVEFTQTKVMKVSGKPTKLAISITTATTILR